MRQIAFFLAIFIGSISASYAQTSISTNHSSFEVQVKRCIAKGQDVYIDMIFSVYNDWRFLTVDRDGFQYRSAIFDDEGNHYGTQSLFFEVDRKINSSAFVEIVKDVPRKVRVIIKNVDEYATKLSSIELFYVGPTSADRGLITIKNLPISRN